MDPMEVGAAEKLGQQIEQQGWELGAAIEAQSTALGKRIDGQEAVSYTHLDVYKRQASRCRSCMIST